jgi:ferric iron reductase protein FhuF
MIAEVAAQVPASLAAFRGGVAPDPDGRAGVALTALHDPDVFEATLATFAARHGPADRRALVSYWSQFYFAALATPALTALMRLGRPLPLAFEVTRLELDEAGRPARLLVPAAGAGPAEGGAGLAGLVEGHLRPFVTLCQARCGLAPRVLWGNAATILDYVAGELGGCGPACDEVATCLGRCGTAPCSGGAGGAGRGEGGCHALGKGPTTPLAAALVPGAAGCRRRRACCLRHRLPGVASCGALCPLDRPTER